MPSAKADANANTQASKTIPKDQLPDPLTTVMNGRVAALQAQILDTTTRMQSAQVYVTAAQASIDAMNVEIIAIQGSITP